MKPYQRGDVVVIDVPMLANSHIPVSYTHLDVYKRQGQSITFVRLADKRPSEGWAGAGNTVTAPAAKTAPAASQVAPKTPMDLAALLG